MEIFVDGGLIELAVAAAFAYAVNFIFLKRYLLILYSVLLLATPILFLFNLDKDVYYILVFFSCFNAVAYVALLWKLKFQAGKHPLFDIKKMTDKFQGKLRKRRRSG